MAAQDTGHLYSLPFENVGMTSNNYNDLTNKPQINGITLVGNKSLSDFEVPTKTSELINDSGFITQDDVPTKTSELTNDSDFITKEYVDNAVDNLQTQLNKYDGITVVKNFFLNETFSSTFDNLATQLATHLAAIKSSLMSDEFVVITDLMIQTIGNLKPTSTIVITPQTDLLTLVIDWQGITYTNNVLQAIDILYKKVLTLTMTNDTNNDGFVSYFEDTTAYNFSIGYTKYKTISLV